MFQGLLYRFDVAFAHWQPHSCVHKHKFIHLGWTRIPCPPCSPDLAPNDFWLYPRLKRNLKGIPCPPCSPDLAPNDFWLYPRLKRNLKGIQFPNLAVLKEAISDKIADIPFHDNQHSMQISWPKRLRCLQEQWGYFEGDIDHFQRHLSPSSTFTVYAFVVVAVWTQPCGLLLDPSEEKDRD